jgi:uncharacterized membrane protein
MASTAAVAVFSLMAAVELVVDKLPSTPSRTEAFGLSGRVMFGGLSGACLAVAGGLSPALGAVLGAAGGVAGAFAGYESRRRLARALGIRDVVIALLEDIVAIGGGLLIASRF